VLVVLVNQEQDIQKLVVQTNSVGMEIALDVQHHHHRHYQDAHHAEEVQLEQKL
jgi:hypothetical protein